MAWRSTARVRPDPRARPGRVVAVRGADRAPAARRVHPDAPFAVGARDVHAVFRGPDDRCARRVDDGGRAAALCLPALWMPVPLPARRSPQRRAPDPRSALAATAAGGAADAAAARTCLQAAIPR